MSLPPRTNPPKLAVFSGGTGGNAIVSAIQAISNHVSYIMPISDNGGSTSEILRVLGGIGVGDLRSRLIRLIPDEDEGTEMFAVKRLLSHRLPVDRSTARSEWLDIVEGISPLWSNITNEKGQAIRSFLRIANSELVKRARPSNLFNFSTGAVGNLFLTGMRLFFGSIETAIFMFASITGIDPHTKVLPILITNYMTPIAALLKDGSIIAGQNAISHPSEFSAVATATQDVTLDEDANLPGSLATLRTAGIAYNKDMEDPLPSRIQEIYYINPYGHRMSPTPNPRVIDALLSADAIIYAPGSLYTSLWPLLIPTPVSTALKTSRKPKIMVLNGSLDRETQGYDALEVLASVKRATGATEAVQVCTHLIYLRGGEGTPRVDEREISRAGIKCIGIQGHVSIGAEGGGGGMRYRPENVESALSTLLNKSVPVRRSTINIHSHVKVDGQSG